MRYISFYIILFCLLSASLGAQYRFDNYKHLTSADGLPSSYTLDIVEDKYGFIWLATAGGLARYDGSKTEKIRAFAEDWEKSFSTVSGWWYGRKVSKDRLDKFNSFDNQKENDAHLERKLTEENGERK